MPPIWDRVRKLEGSMLSTVRYVKPFHVVAVRDESVQVQPEDGSGTIRSVPREHIERIAGLELQREEVYRRTRQEFPKSQNTSYIAAIAFAVSTRSRGL
jgi:hypothetical protein